ncbi:hypothetical protein [Marinicellulosiphila megalodicopiae]|uniref:hypothetical protein n=1 Tax=Marinicellulosiphila megalodicopiae TaxID=2724896 RepID=UPI003BB19D3A
MKFNLTKAQEIQFIFPEEPDWDVVDDSVLIELIKDYDSEQSCATSALTELSCRKNSDFNKLCVFIIKEENTDIWLKEHAYDLLLSKDFLEGLIFSDVNNIAKLCSLRMLSVLISALNYELQGDFRELILSHKVTNQVKARLLSEKSETIEFSDIFYQHLENV